jgi:hypothetical protein
MDLFNLVQLGSLVRVVYSVEKEEQGSLKTLKQVSQNLYKMFYLTKNMKQKDKFDRIFKIVVLGFLALILFFQIIPMISFENNYPFGEEYIVDVGYEDFFAGSEMFDEQKSFHSTYDIYTYEEFSKLINTSIKNNKDLSDYAKEKGYEFYNEESLFLIIEIGEECIQDKIRNIELCTMKYLEADEENNQIILSSNTAFEEAIMISSVYEGEFLEHE